MSDYTPSFNAARLFEKKSSKGNTYFTGRMGGDSVTVLKSSEVSESGEPIWHLMFAEAPAKPARRNQSSSSDAAPRCDYPRPPADTAKPAPNKTNAADVEMPF